jgi:putative oxidoreductase
MIFSQRSIIMADNSIRRWLFDTAGKAPSATILLRLMAGGVFLWEGILKFVYPNLGVGRFLKLGIPIPGVSAPFVAVLEIVGGLCLISGFLTRLFSVLFIIEMTVAILSTKIPMLMGTYPLALAPSPPQSGIGLVLHEIRSDYAQIMTSIFLLIAGPGRLSIDSLIARRTRHKIIISEEKTIRERQKIYQE